MSRFMISDERGLYLHKDFSGNYIPVKNKMFGDFWEQYEKASNVLKNCISRNLRNRYKIIEVEDATIPKQKIKDDIVKRIGNEPIEEDYLSSLPIDIDNFAKFIQNMEQRKEVLASALSDVNKEIIDINHYIEFGRFNAYQGWLAFNLLRGRLKKRRKVKDELQILSQFEKCNADPSIIASVKALIEELNTRKYKPRKLNELFE